MTAKITSWLKVAFAVGLAGAISACSSSPSSNYTATTPPVTNMTAQADQFGTAYGTDYRAPADSEPANVSDSDIVAVSASTEPANAS